MKTKIHFTLGLALLLTLNPARSALSQTTAFTYQGSLADSGSQARGIYDLRFTLYDSVSNSNLVAGPLTNSSVSVSNGLFTVALDFGAGVFSGADRWLEIGVRTNGDGAFTALSPRQKLTASPYSITAFNLSGAVGSAAITG